MAYELTPEEKRSIVNGQIRNVLYRKYTAEVELIVENAVATPNDQKVSDLNAEIAKCEDQHDALTAELERIA